MLYAFQALTAISLSWFSTYLSENVNIRGVTIKKKSINLCQITGRGKSICLHKKKSLLAPTVYDIEKEKK